MALSLERVVERVARTLSPENAAELLAQKKIIVESLRAGLAEEGLATRDGVPLLVNHDHLPHSPQEQYDSQMNNLDVIEPDGEVQGFQEAERDSQDCVGERTPSLQNDFSSVSVSSTQASEAYVPYREFPMPDKPYPKNLLLDAECLVISSFNMAKLSSRVVPKGNYYGNESDEVLAIRDLLLHSRSKELVSLAPFPVRGPGRLVGVWEDNEKCSHSKEFYLALIEDFLKSCKTPGAVIWYSGHGEDSTGNWCFKDGVISLHEVFDLYQTYFQQRLLYVISDCSFSGCWVRNLACLLDDMGIPPCGHHAREQGILLKLWTSCDEHEQATFMEFVAKDVSISKVDLWLTFNYNRAKGSDTLQQSRHFSTPHLRCASREQNVCSLEQSIQIAFKSLSPNLNWHYFTDSLADLLFTVRGKDQGKPAWHYVLVDPIKRNQFKHEISTGNVDVSHFGKILASGWGKDPPEDIKKVMDSFFS